MFGGAAYAEGRAFLRPFLALQDQPADAFATFLRAVIGHTETLLGIEFRVRRTQAQPTQRDFPDPAPFAVHDGEYLAHDLLRRFIAVALHRARVLVFDL